LLSNSGTALFAGSASEFAEEAPASRLTAHLVREFGRRHGTVTESEERSWRNSLAAMAAVTKDAIPARAGVGVELKLPGNDRRIDVSFVARDQDHEPHVVLVELKQWEEAAPSAFPEMVRLPGGLERSHPSVQAANYAAYLRAGHSAFTEHDYRLSPCSYLHNMPRAASHSLRGTAFAGPIREAPLFTRGDEADLTTFLRERVGGGDGLELLPDLVQGRYAPSRRLLDQVGKGLANAPGWILLDEQRDAFNIVRGLAERAAQAGTKGVLLVLGGPGTGKSVIAAHLLVAMSRDGTYRVAHATGSKAFTTVLRAVGGRASTSLFRYFNNFGHKRTAENELDVLVCDEAHRIRVSSNERFTKRALRSEIPQVQELIRAGRVVVFLMDEEQHVRPGEIGSASVVREAAKSAGVELHEVRLESQFRCNGCKGYLDWVNHLFSDRPEAAGPWLATGEYDLRVFEDPASMEAALRARSQAGYVTRTVAGFCWPWSDPRPDSSLADDVRIGEWSRPWNAKSPEQWRKAGSAPTPANHPYYRWATSPDCAAEVGCIYSAQGFEFDYCGVILGNDLTWRPGAGWTGNRAASFDPSIARRKIPALDVTRLLQHTYRVLLTRGMLGTYVVSTDFDTREFLQTLAAKPAIAG
jgi:DUF2075 family protein